MFLFNVLTMAIGNINDAPIRLNALVMENLRVSYPVLVDRFTRHYGQEAVSQVCVCVCVCVWLAHAFPCC